MHLYFFIRGKFERVKEWEAHAQASYWKFRRINNETQQEEIILVQGALRPSVLGAYEFVFPKEALAEVCSFLGITKNESYGFSKVGLNTRHFVLRQIFGCKQIPDDVLDKASKIPPTFSTAEFERGCSNCVLPGIAIHVIGIKEDGTGIIGNYTQELL